MVANDNDGSLRLGVELDLGEAQKDAKSLSQTLKEMSGAFASSFNTADKAQQKAAASAAKANEAIKKQEGILSDLQRRYDALKSGDVAPKGLKQLETDAARAEKEFNKLVDGYESAKDKADSLDFGINTSALQQARLELDNIRNAMNEAAARSDELKARLETARMNPAASMDAQKLADDISLASDKLARLRDAAYSAAEASGKLEGGFFKIPQFMKDAASSVASFGKKAGSVFSTIGGVIKRVFTGAGKHTKGYGNVFEKTFNRIKTLATRVFFFSIITRAMRSVVDELGNYIAINKDFTNSLQIAKGNLLSAFQPILEVVMPALSALGQGLVHVTGLLLQFISILTGKSIAQMQASAKAANNQANALKGVGKEAKKAKGELYSFDEINKQAAETTAGVGGGGEELPVFEPPKFDVPEWLKEITIEIKAGDWEGVGNSLAESLMNALDGVDWTAWGQKLGTFLQNGFEIALGFLSDERLNEIGAHIANFINGIFDKLDPETVGATVGEFFNRVFGIMQRFAETLEWASIGKWIATAIMTAVETFDVAQAATAIAGIMNGIFRLFYETVTGINWAEIGAKIGEFVTTWFKEMDWALLGAAISEFIIGVADLISTALLETDWNEVWGSLKELFAAVDWLGIAASVSRLLGAALGTIVQIIFTIGANIAQGLWNGITSKLKDAYNWVKTNIVDPIVNSVKDLFGIHSPSTVFEDFGINIVEGLWNGINGLAEWILDNIRGFGDSILNFFKGIFGGGADETAIPISKEDEQAKLDDVEKIWGELPTWFATSVTSVIATSLATFWADRKTENQTALTDAQTVWTVFPAWITEMILTPIATSLSTFWTDQETGSKTALTNIQTELLKVPGWFQEKIYTPMKNGMRTFLNEMTTMVESFAKSTLDAVDAIVDSIRSIQISIPEILGGGTASYSVSYGRVPVKLPRLAMGDVVQPGKEFLAVLGDNKTEQEVVSPLSTIEEAVTRAMGGQEMVSLLREILQALRDGSVISVDGRTFGELSSKLGKEYDGLRAVLT